MERAIAHIPIANRQILQTKNKSILSPVFGLKERYQESNVLTCYFWVLTTNFKEGIARRDAFFSIENRNG